MLCLNIGEWDRKKKREIVDIVTLQTLIQIVQQVLSDLVQRRDREQKKVFSILKKKMRRCLRNAAFDPGQITLISGVAMFPYPSPLWQPYLQNCIPAKTLLKGMEQATLHNYSGPASHYLNYHFTVLLLVGLCSPLLTFLMNGLLAKLYYR